MLELSKFIGKGAKRMCFEHPDDSNKCVKVVVRSCDEHLLYRELNTYLFVKPILGEYIVVYETELMDTNLGKGLVCQLLRDDGGEYSKSLLYYVREKKVDSEILNQIQYFAGCLVEHEVFFYDFNLQNFIVQIKDGRKCVYYTDLKSFEKYKAWTFLRLETVFTPLSRYCMKRRLLRLFDKLGLEHIKAPERALVD